MSLEPGARDDGNEPIQAALESIAISLKRIADAIPTEGSGFAQLDNAAWLIGQTLGRGFEIGSRR